MKMHNVEVIPDHVYAALQRCVETRGYVVANSQLSFMGQSTDNIHWIFDLTSSKKPNEPRVSLFWTSTPIDELTREDIQPIRSLTENESVSFLAFTNEGDDFRTFAVSGSSVGSLDFLPRISINKEGLTKVRSISGLQPFPDIYQLRRLISRLSDAIFTKYGHDRLKLFDTLLLLITTKIYDEVEHPHDLHLPELLGRGDSELVQSFESFSRRALKDMQCDSFGEGVYLDPETLRTCLELLVPYSFRLTAALGTQTGALGTFYQEIVSSTFRGSLGAYFTPKPLTDFAVKICKPSHSDTILDTSCGSGTFLLSAFAHAYSSSKDKPEIFGCDIQERMVLTTRINCFLHGMGDPHLIHGDGLKIDLGHWHSLDSSVPREGFSLVVGNPPFAGFEKATSLPYKGSSATQGGTSASVNKVVPFIAKTVQLLRPGGRAILVIPISVLNGKAAPFTELREWLTSEVEVRAIIGLPREAFAHTDTGVQGALFFFQRKPGDSKEPKVFFKNIENVGYDSRGRPIPGSEFDDVIASWEDHLHSNGAFVDLEELYQLDRWDPTWLEGYTNGATTHSEVTHVRLTDLCKVVKRRLAKGDFDLDTVYRYFQVGDTDMDTGEVTEIRNARGQELANKSRLRIPVEEGDVLLPNHRDSLVAKTAAETGRSAVLVTKKEGGCITTNRFTLLKPLIDPRLLVFVLNSGLVRKQLALRARGSASLDIRDGALKQVWVPKKIIEDPNFQEEVLAALEERNQVRQQLDQTNKRVSQLMKELEA